MAIAVTYKHTSDDIGQYSVLVAGRVIPTGPGYEGRIAALVELSRQAKSDADKRKWEQVFDALEAKCTNEAQIVCEGSTHEAIVDGEDVYRGASLDDLLIEISNIRATKWGP